MRKEEESIEPTVICVVIRIKLVIGGRILGG